MAQFGLLTGAEVRVKDTTTGSLFEDETFHYFKGKLTSRGHLMKSHAMRYIKILTATQDDDPLYFWQETGRSNLLVFLYLNIGENKLAREQNIRTLQKSHNNINALFANIRIHEADYSDIEAEKARNQVSKIDCHEMEVQKLICAGEIAYMCSCLGPTFHTESIERYEKLLQSDTSGDPRLQSARYRWQYYLAQTYNRQLNKGQKQKLFTRFSITNIEGLFEKISKYFLDVIDNGDDDYKGKAMIELVDLYKKCQTADKVALKFPAECSVEEYVENAIKAAPSDCYVLERCGRHYRQHSKGENDARRSIEILEKSLKICPGRHVALHHMGLAYRQLWMIRDKRKPAELFTNKSRENEPNKFVYTLPQLGDKTCEHNNNSDSAVEILASAEESSIKETRNPPIASNIGLPLDSMAAESAAQQQEYEQRKQTPVHPANYKTLHPKCPAVLGKCPIQTENPSYFDTLRTSNPEVNTEGQDVLQKAKECFEKASSLVEDTSVRYLVDLARACLSLGQHEEAEDMFRKADRLSDTMDDNDACYLYEQWAIMRNDLQRSKAVVEQDYLIANVAPLYRKAILASIRSQDRSRKAFYDLRDILKTQIEKEPTNEALKLEYDVLYRTTKDFRGKPDKSFHEALVNNPEMQKTAWNMIDLLYQRKHAHDAAIAFTYLSALLKLGSLGSEKHPVDKSISKRQLQVVEIAWTTACNSEDAYAENGKAFGDVFRWFVGSKILSDLGIQVGSSNQHRRDRNPDVCILATDDSATVADRIKDILINTCGLDAIKALADGGGDIIAGAGLGSYIIDFLFTAVEISKTVVIIENSAEGNNWKNLKPVLTQLLTLDRGRVCLVIDPDCINTEERYIKHWPAFILNHECNDLCVAHTLFKTMFLQQTTSS